MIRWMEQNEFFRHVKSARTLIHFIKLIKETCAGNNSVPAAQ